MADSAIHYLDEAQRTFAKIEQLDPKYALFINNTLGILYRRLGKYEASLAEYDKALQRHKDEPRYVYLAGIYSSKANTLAMLNRLDEAIELQLKSLNVNEHNADSHRIINNFHNIGLLFYKLKRTEERRIGKEDAIKCKLGR